MFIRTLKPEVAFEAFAIELFENCVAVNATIFICELPVEEASLGSLTVLIGDAGLVFEW